MSEKVFLLLKRLSYSCKGFYAGSWIMNKVMNCSCCLLFCQSADWLESRLDPSPLLSLFASDPWKAARRQQIEPGIEYGGAEARFLRSPLNGLHAHTDAVDVKHRPEYTRHSQSLNRKEGHKQQLRDSAGWDDAEQEWRRRHCLSFILMLKGTQISLSHSEVMWLRGLYSNCHFVWRRGSVTVCNDGYVACDGLRLCMSHLK